MVFISGPISGYPAAVRHLTTIAHHLTGATA